MVAAQSIGIGHLNVRSLTNKLDDVMILLEDHCFDILYLSETWLPAQVLDKFLAFPGYRLLRWDYASAYALCTAAHGYT